LIEPTTLRQPTLAKVNGGSLEVLSEIQILGISPLIDCGRFCPKRILGDNLLVTAEILKPGNHILAADLAWRMRGANEWNRVEMQYSVNDDNWTVELLLSELGFLEFRIEAWEDVFSKIIQDIRRWQGADQDVTPDVEALIELSKRAAQSASHDDRSRITQSLSKLPEIAPAISSSEISSLADILSEKSLSSLIVRNLEKKDFVASPVYTLIVDRPIARYSTWYEMFHRSQGKVEGVSATFKDCEARLGEIKEMGFDVVYLPPIHPIGITNRRGPNNSPSNSKNDPGSPWATGNGFGGHDAVNPDLGTMQDFTELVTSVNNLGMEIALDLAFQVSPDHPYVRQHPEWFYHQPDGTIRFAENPPKRYYDIYPLNFENADWRSLWEELRRVVEFWIEKGVKIFRVDNPHTKPIPFWEWLTFSARMEHPEVIFLSEAFTRPNSMKLLAKAGFDQSYTYFTWKNSKSELSEFLKEFFFSEAREYYRPNLFTNTPDILTEYLQTGGRAAFKVRETLAATLSSSYGIYNGFELCENRAKSEHSEEYMDSEKYQYKVWDWNREGNIKDYITKMNWIRKENPALQENSTLRLLDCEGDQIIFYGKWTPDLSNVILVAVNLDPFSTHETMVSIPVKELGLHGNYTVRDLISERDFVWNGERNYVKLDPNLESAHILRLERHN
jgi:starch synthase (maltosyl-transferring)